jgi:hypothetical protein
MEKNIMIDTVESLFSVTKYSLNLTLVVASNIPGQKSIQQHQTNRLKPAPV